MKQEKYQSSQRQTEVMEGFRGNFKHKDNILYTIYSKILWEE